MGLASRFFWAAVLGGDRPLAPPVDPPCCCPRIHTTPAAVLRSVDAHRAIDQSINGENRNDVVTTSRALVNTTCRATELMMLSASEA